MEDTNKVIIIISNNGHVSFKFDPALGKEERSFRSHVASQLMELFADGAQDSQDEDD